MNNSVRSHVNNSVTTKVLIIPYSPIIRVNSRLKRVEKRQTKHYAGCRLPQNAIKGS